MPIGTRRRGKTSPGRALAWIAFAALGALQPHASRGEPLRLLVAEEPHMGLVVRISAYFPPDASPPVAFREAFGRVAALEAKFSTYRQDSELRRLQAAAWRVPTPVSPEMAFVLGHALRIARDSGGAFDPTVGSVTRLLRQGSERRRGPPEAALREAWIRTGWDQIRLDMPERMVSLSRRDLQLDLGGIAKGYIADEALAAMQRAGAPRSLVAVAGDIAVGAPPPGAAGWRIGLDGAGPRGSVERELVLSNRGVSTSGGRERRFLIGEQRCSHILGQAELGCTDSDLAVSVVARTAVEADGLATALIALGRARAAEFLQKRPGLSVYWSDGTPLDLQEDARLP